jgi:glycosyltransferase involved in cell wall biosynthesis
MKEFIVAPEVVAAALDRLHRDKAHRAELAARGHRHATSPAYRWETIGAAWDRLLRDIAREGVQARMGLPLVSASPAR